MMDSKTETVSDNELIAQFMGLEAVQSWGTLWWKIPHTKGVQSKALKYDTSWDWIMPVVDKISQIHDSKFEYDIDQIKQGQWPSDDKYMNVIALPLATPISEVHKSVVAFIRWYNYPTPEQ